MLCRKCHAKPLFLVFQMISAIFDRHTHFGVRLIVPCGQKHSLDCRVNFHDCSGRMEVFRVLRQTHLRALNSATSGNFIAQRDATRYFIGVGSFFFNDL
jgi:hypothetical protein